MRPRHFLRLLVHLSLVLVITLRAVFASDLPSMGESADAFLTPADEKRLADSFMRNVRRSIIVIDDPELNEYISALGYKLVASSDQPDTNFKFFIVQHPSINAFAAPGGYIGIHSGLILATQSESELAAVLAHEIAHITQKHLARAIEAASKMTVPTTAALIGAIILASQNSQLGQAALTATAAGATQAQINFTRNNEQEADTIGILTLARAGFDPRGMPLFFDRLQKTSRLYENNLPEFLQTHPVSHTRIAEAMARAERLGGAPLRPGRMYYLARAKMRILTQNDAEQNVRYFTARLEKTSGTEQQAMHYGHALALAAVGKSGAARRELLELVDGNKNQVSYIIALARLEVANGRVAQGLDRYAKALQLFPHNRPLTLYYATALIDNGQAEQARRLIQPLMHLGRPTPAEYQLLARAQKLSGQAGAAHEALAEYRFLIGDTPGAIAQLRFALKMLSPEDRIRKTRIRARLTQLEKEALTESKAASKHE